MLAQAPIVERLSKARRHIDALRSALLSSSPDELERCLPALEEAAGLLRAAEQEIRSSVNLDTNEIDTNAMDTSAMNTNVVEAIRIEASALKDSLAVARRVIAQGSAFYEGWLRALGVAAGGYTAAGEPAALAPAATVSVKG